MGGNTILRKVKDFYKKSKAKGEYLGETEKDLVGCSVMISYSRKGWIAARGLCTR